MNEQAPQIPAITEIHVYNPGSTMNNGYRPPEDSLSLETIPDRDKNIAKLGNMMVGEGRYKLRVRAGDGSLGWILQAAIESDKEVEIEIEPGGYKNDVASMVEKAGGRIAINPLVLERKTDSEKWESQRMVAYSYGMGGMAVGAALSNGQEFRAEKQARIERLTERFERWHLPKWISPKVVGSLWSDIKLFGNLMKPEVSIGGKVFPTSALINGERVAAMIVSSGQMMSGGWMRFWQNLHDRGFVTTFIGNGRLSKVALPLLRVVKLPALNDIWTIGSGNPFEVGEDSLVQADGEDFEIEKGTYRLRELDNKKVTVSVNTGRAKQAPGDKPTGQLPGEA